MGPDTNKTLFEVVAKPRVAATREEFMRRELAYATLDDLSVEFTSKEQTEHPVTEPTLPARLYALSHVQRTRIGVAGFNPLEALQSGGDIKAKAAPFHDEFSDDTGFYRTRVISLTMGDVGRNEVEIFGLNFYQPEISIGDVSVREGDDGQASRGLILVGERGVMDKRSPIAGETVVLGVRNKRTSDAKFYRVEVDNESHKSSVPGFESNIEHQSDHKIRVKLPDNTFMIVEQLTGELQSQVIDEFEKSIGKLQKKSSPIADLSDEEREALHLG